jgi:tol-pal system protein YbgF
MVQLSTSPEPQRPVPPVPPFRGSATRVLLAFAAFLPLTACATKADVRDLQDSILELHAQQNALLRELQRDQDAMADSLKLVTRGLQDFRGETLRRVTNMEDHLLRIQELTGLSQQQLSTLRDELDRDRAQSTLGAGGGPGGFQFQDAPAGVAEDVYFAALAQFQRGGLTTARMGFEDVVANYPNDPLAPEARYLLADILVQEGQVAQAIQTFLEIPEFHPTAPRVPDALYRAAMLHVEEGDRSAARPLLERVVNTWPDSGAADLAREAILDLD